jgi:hypothetical protein
MKSDGRSYPPLAYLSSSLLLATIVGCGPTAYYGPNAATMETPATVLTLWSHPRLQQGDRFQITEIDGKAAPATALYGLMGKPALDDSAHEVAMSAARVQFGRQMTASGKISFRPTPGREYLPDGRFDGDNWVLWISDRASGEPASPTVTVKAEVAPWGPIAGH